MGAVGRQGREQSTSISLEGNTGGIYHLASQMQKIPSNRRLWSDAQNPLKCYRRNHGAKRIISHLNHCKGESISYGFYPTLRLNQLS